MFICFVLTEEFFADQGNYISLKRITCFYFYGLHLPLTKILENFVFEVFGNSSCQLNFDFLFPFNSSKH